MALDKKTCIAYGSFSLFLSILHNIFLLYHVETFVSIYSISRGAFWLAEAIFLAWNSFNDQLFGWLSDKSLLRSQIQNTDVVFRRVRSLRFAGPMLALAFMMFWHHFLPVGLQFLLCLCLYDSFLTIVDLQQSALLADLTISGLDRVHLGTYSAVFSSMGSLSVFLSYLFWDKEKLEMFRIFCLVLALISASGFRLSCGILERTLTSEKCGYFPRSSVDKCEDSENLNNLKTYFHQVVKHKNFLWFASMNVIQVFNCHFNSNFFPLFLEVLLKRKLSPTVASMLLGVSFLAPHVNNLYFMYLCRKHGAYRVVRGLFVLKLFLCMIMWWMGPSLVFLSFFIASNRIFTEGTCKLLNLVITDLVDEDVVIHNRPQAVSALIFGTSSFLSKPGQTLAPLIGTWLLAWHTGKVVFGNLEEGAWPENSTTLSKGYGTTSPQYEDACFWLLVWVPFVCSLVQLALWCFFTLHGQRLHWVKQMRAFRETGPRHHQNI